MKSTNFIKQPKYWKSAVLLFFYVGICFFPFFNLEAQTISLWRTKGDQSEKIKQQSNISFNSNAVANPTIAIDENSKSQSIDGFGFMLTQGSAKVIKGLNASVQNSLLNEIFNPNSGNASAVVRISIGASDLSDSVYTYNQTSGDTNMNNFSLNGPDTRDLLPILKKILAINPKIKVLATPWTAPTWMKTNNSYIGGSLQTRYYAAYARYFIKYLDAMKAEGIDIWAITPQNEPGNPNNEPSMSMNSTEQKNFINNNLGPAIANSPYATKIIAYDHNCDNLAFPIDVLKNSDFVDGAAFHLYDPGVNIAGMSTVHDQTGKNVYFTEQFTSSEGNFDADFGWHTENVVIGSLRNWSKTVIEWNLASDPNFEPRTPGGCTTCLGAITVNNSNNFTRNVSNYIIGQISRFVDPGARRIKSNANGILNVAFVNPNGSKVLLVYNKATTAKTITVNWNSRSFRYNVPGRSAVTYTWSGVVAPPVTPLAPKGLSATAGEGKVSLTWNGSNGADSYSVRRATASGGPYAEIKSNVTGTSYTNTGLNNGTRYYYRVRAKNSAGTSGDSNTANALPQIELTNAYSKIEAESFDSSKDIQTEDTADSGGGKNVGHTDTNDYIAFDNVNFGNGAGSVEVRIASNATFTGTIEFRLGSASGTLIGRASVGNTGGWQSWITRKAPINNASGVKKLFLVFKGGNGIGNVNWFRFSTSGLGNPPAPPTSLKATAGNARISLSWNASTGARAYDLRRATASGGPYSTIKSNLTSTSYTNTGLTNGTRYYYRVKAKNDAGSSGDSNTVNAVPKDDTPPPTSSGIVSGGTYRITSLVSGKVMDVSDVSTSNGARIQQWQWENGNNQKWKVENAGGGAYKLTAVHSGKVLDLVDGSTNNGTQIQQWESSNNDNQKWKIEPIGGGYYRIISVKSNKAIDVPGGNKNNGTKLVTWAKNNGNNQKWSFQLLTGAKEGDVVKGAKVTVYPNPTNGSDFMLSYQTTTLSTTQIAIMDMVGRKVQLISYNPQRIGIQTISLASYIAPLESGQYFISVGVNQAIPFVKN